MTDLWREKASAEYWAMRIITDASGMKDLQARVDNGELAYVNGDLCEPLEVYKTEAEAIDRCARESSTRSWDCKVVMVL
jgi:hypothetical protein